MSETIIMPPVEPQNDAAPPIKIRIPMKKTIVITVMAVLVLALAGVAAAGTILLGQAHGATGQAQAQLHSTQSKLSASQS